MPADPAASIAGVSIRVTRLDEEGNLLTGEFDSYTTSAFIRVSFTPEYEEGDEITEKAADGTICVSYKAPDTLKRVNMEIAICNPDPELSNLMSGGLLLSGPQGGDAAKGVPPKEVSLGWASAQVGEDPSGNGVAVEVWSKAIQNGKPAAPNPYFHWVFPFVKTRLSGDRVIENGLLATTFEGYGVGNLQFRNGPDGMWRWPAATDRPYMYARSPYAPQGLNGFFQWDAGTFDANGALAQNPAGNDAPDAFFTNVNPAVGINVKGGKNPYPYRSDMPDDAILSATDYEPGEKVGSTRMSAAADGIDVANVPPNKPGVDQNPVTYLGRKLNPASASPGDHFAADAAITGAAQANLLAGKGFKANPQTAWKPGEQIFIGTVPFHWDGTAWAGGPAPAAVTDASDAGVFTPTGAPLPASLAVLQGLGVTANPNTAWTFGKHVVLRDNSHAYWDGAAWKAGNAPGGTVAPGDTVADPAGLVTASDVTNAANLAQLGFTANPTTAWTTGQKVTIGTFDFHWDGAAWAAGAAA